MDREDIRANREGERRNGVAVRSLTADEFVVLEEVALESGWECQGADENGVLQPEYDGAATAALERDRRITTFECARCGEVCRTEHHEVTARGREALALYRMVQRT